MIDVKRKFLVLNGEVVYFDRIMDFAVQRRMEIFDTSELSKLQPGTLTVELVDEIPKNITVDGNNVIGAYLINYAVVFNDPTLFFNSTNEGLLHISIKSEMTDIIFHSHKYPPISRLKPITNLICDERNKDKERSKAY